MMMMWCDHCCRETQTRFEGIVMSCDYCGKVLADLYPQHENPKTIRRGKKTKQREKLTKKSDEDTASTSMGANIKEFMQEICSETSQISDNKEWMQEINSQTRQISDN